MHTQMGLTIFKERSLPCLYGGKCLRIKNLLYPFFWVIPRHLNFICRRFGKFYLFHLHRRIGMKDLSAYEDGTECSETSVYIIQTPGNYPEESIQHSEQGENLKSRIKKFRCRKKKIKFKCGYSHWVYYIRILPLFSIANQKRSYLPEKSEASTDRFSIRVS